MKSATFPVAYLPPVSWWAHALQYDLILLETEETYPKQTYRNRCEIYGSEGILQLVIPVKKVNGNHTQTREIKPDNSRNWQTVHWRSLVSCYNKTPYFQYYSDKFYQVYNEQSDTLAGFDLALIKVILGILKQSHISVEFTKTYIKPENRNDFRVSVHPKLPPSQSGLVHFPGYFQAFEPIKGFIGNLSIFDTLCNLGPDTLSYLNKVYSLNINEIRACGLDNQS